MVLPGPVYPPKKSKNCHNWPVWAAYDGVVAFYHQLYLIRVLIKKSDATKYFATKGHHVSSGRVLQLVKQGIDYP